MSGFDFPVKIEMQKKNEGFVRYLHVRHMGRHYKGDSKTEKAIQHGPKRFDVITKLSLELKSNKLKQTSFYIVVE